MSYFTPQDLFDALALAPELPDAACVGLWEAFDPAPPGETPEDTEYRYQTAQHVCRTCPALASCAEWVDSLPKSKRPRGVVAGQINTPKPIGRPARKAG
ncbi:hypothetical protein [[Mycobacterium] wendilense]|uniref:4Fe-4S Wbl-type domain-containing protein n=1 Tax=[Mycobacterium] wendilense TaxID=3064284 RepID=A0ABM9M8J5_9MYCO|nr:hypothetical protein [Mycolicibacterium sp. MU0050]CAJ1578983.1 hypothetical protein MU0050_000278 [Mycolicibacterium sp. MU0050]